MSTAIHTGTGTAHSSRDEDVAVWTLSPQSREMHDLTLEELYSSLSDLGHNPYGELVYTRSHLASKHLRAVPGLQQYAHLQRLCVNDNHLTELDAVRYMPQLVHLHACHNRLTSDVFASLAASAAGCLEQLYLDDNCITSLDGLEKLPFLLDFTCRSNQVRHLPAHCLSAAQRLTRFSLRGNTLERVDTNAFAVAQLLRELELSENLLSSTDFLYSVTSKIEKVNIASNSVRRLSAAVEVLSCLSVLDVGRNELSGLKELLVLRRLKGLRTLEFAGNTGLEHLPHHASGEDGRLGDPLATAMHGTEYHEEVVMSDEEENCRSLCSGGDSSEAPGAASITTATTGAATSAVAAGEGSSALEKSSTLSLVFSATDKLAENAGDSVPKYRRCRSAIPGWGFSKSLAVQAATPTTAAYADLAASEAHSFVHAMGSMRRDGELDVRVHHQKEVLALPQEEQVYLWTLSVLPQLTMVNGRLIRPEEVAKATFLFGANATEWEGAK
ncbi:hypothetical protein MNV84_07933 [Leishmania braziliensis]|nr:hypothetical protein MNV84_07933 [Leishmania braziliensis]